MTFGELTEKLSMEEFYGWMAYFNQRAKQPEDEKNLANKSEEDILKGFGLM